MVLVDTEAGTGNAFEAFDDRATGVVLKTNVKFGLCRGMIRDAAMRGDIPGLVKASW